MNCRKAQAAVYARPGESGRRSAIWKEILSRPGVIERRVASYKATAALPEVKARMAASSKESQNRPEVKEKLSNFHRERLASPGARAELSRKLLAAAQRPEVKANRSAAQKINQSRAEVKAKQRASAIARGQSWQLDDRGGFIYVLINTRTGALKVGSAVDVAKRRRQIIQRGYLEFAAPGDQLEVVLAIHCDYFRRVELRAQELLGMDEHHRQMYGEQTFASIEDCEEAVRKAIREIDGGTL